MCGIFIANLRSPSREHVLSAISSTSAALRAPHSHSEGLATLDLHATAHSRLAQKVQDIGPPILHVRCLLQVVCTASYARLRSTSRCSCLAWTCWAPRWEHGVASAAPYAEAIARLCNRSLGAASGHHNHRLGRSGRHMPWAVWRALLRSFLRMRYGLLVAARSQWPCAKMVVIRAWQSAR